MRYGHAGLLIGPSGLSSARGARWFDPTTLVIVFPPPAGCGRSEPGGVRRITATRSVFLCMGSLWSLAGEPVAAEK